MIIGLEPSIFALVVVAALFGGVLHGATGMAGGLLIAAILSYVIGIKAAVPVVTVTLVISHFSRVLLYFQHADWRIVMRVLGFGGPMIIAGAVVFGLISPRSVAIVFAVFLSLSFPIKYWARRNDLKTGPKLLAGASVIWGMLAGNVIGPGFFLAPFLLGTGMGRMTYVGTLAVITFVMNIVKIGVFGATALIDQQLLLLGIVTGLITVPGNWIGKSILMRMRDSDHRLAIDVMTAILIVSFVVLALRS
ncbi:MAG: sulfite exporter TauE/SafE family protein [Pseudomonadota bacterium]